MQNRPPFQAVWLFLIPVCLLLGLDAEFLIESVHAAATVNKLLLTCKEGMAFRADFYTNITFCGTCLNHFATSTFNFAGSILGMDIFLHANHLVSSIVTHDGAQPNVVSFANGSIT